MKIREADDRNRSEISSKMRLTYANRCEWIVKETPKACLVIEKYPKLTAYKGAMVGF